MLVLTSDGIDSLLRVRPAEEKRTELTATELRVAELVAAGRSNREVADMLFVCVRTVESNPPASTANSACAPEPSLPRTGRSRRAA